MSRDELELVLKAVFGQDFDDAGRIYDTIDVERTGKVDYGTLHYQNLKWKTDIVKWVGRKRC